MNDSITLRTQRSALRIQRAFTLVELLVVMAIIGLLAGLIIHGASLAMVKARISRVQTERMALITAIQQYKNHKGYYPPDNTNNTARSALYYELTGTVPTNNPSQGFVAVNGEFLKTNDMFTLFGTTGFLNSSADPTQPAENFFGAAGKSMRTGSFNIPSDPAYTYTLFGIPVPPGPPASLGTVSGTQIITPWNYVSSNPTNNSAEFDLWMDVAWAGKTNRISNWSNDPQVIH